jgi:NAD(P)-dependent dehydrogenase (short-subunit alcohol dehydrogenase family)
MLPNKEVPMSFNGKKALITGGSRGIGRGIALKLAEGGAQVAVHYYQNKEAAQATLEKIRSVGSDGFLVQADVCRPEEVLRIFQQVRSEFGSLDIFVSNARPEAATFYQGPMDITLDKWDTAMDSQAKAFLIAVREAAPLMSNGGRIIAISFAPGGRFGSWQPWVAMGAAKAAMEVLVRYFAVALAHHGITVNTISPGWVEDSVLNSLPEAFQTGIREWQERGWTPMGRLGTPADIGNAVALLCSDEAAWITGQLIDVDGGASLVDAHLPLEFQGIAKAKSAGAA